MSADSRDSLRSGFAALAQKLKLDEKDAPELDLVVRAVRAWLENRANGKWLLVLDNADDLALAQQFMPAGRHGHILLTARPKETGLIPGIEIEYMEPDQGALFLLRRAKVLAVEKPLDTASDDDLTLAKSIAVDLGGLPLALDQAGAYIEEKQQTLAQYQRRYRRDEGKKLRARRGDLAGPNHPRSVTTTFSMAFQAVSAENPAGGRPAPAVCVSGAGRHPGGVLYGGGQGGRGAARKGPFQDLEKPPVAHTAALLAAALGLIVR